MFPLLLPLVDWLRRVPLRKDLGRLSLFWLTALLLFAWRWHVLGGFGGYADAATGRSEMLSMGWLVPVKVLLLRIWGPLFFPLNWSLAPGLAGALTLAVGAVAYFTLARASDGRRKILFAIGLTLLCSLPALSQLLIGANMEKSRGLYLPSVGFCLLLGVLATSRFRVTLLIVVAAFQLVVLEHNLAIWANTSDFLQVVSREAAAKIPKTAEVVTVLGAPRTVDGGVLSSELRLSLPGAKSGTKVEVGLPGTREPRTVPYAGRIRIELGRANPAARAKPPIRSRRVSPGRGDPRGICYLMSSCPD